MTVEEVLERHQGRLMAVRGVVGVGEGENAGAPVIIVMVDALTPELADALPREVEGYPVQVDVTGEIAAL